MANQRWGLKASKIFCNCLQMQLLFELALVLLQSVEATWHGYQRSPAFMLCHHSLGLKRLSPPGSHLLRQAWFITWHLRWPFLGECQWGPKAFLEPLGSKLQNYFLMGISLNINYTVTDMNFVEKKLLFAELIQCWDDRSLLSVMQDTKDNGW